MKRRRLLGAIGIATAGGVVAGTGAFTSVEAERELTVAVENDEDALLRLSPNIDAPGFAEFSDGKIGFDINDVFEEPSRGPGSNSVYVLERIFYAENQGTQPVYFESNFESVDTIEGLDFIVESNRDSLLDGEEAVGKLEVGQEVSMGLRVDTTGVDVGFIEDTETSETDNIDAKILATAEEPDDEVEIVEPS